jgi:hypothetical protein
MKGNSINQVNQFYPLSCSSCTNRGQYDSTWFQLVMVLTLYCLKFRIPILCLSINYGFHIALFVLSGFYIRCCLLSLLSTLTVGGRRIVNAILAIYALCF